MFNSPQGVSLDAAGNVIIADTSNHRIRCFDVATGIVPTLAGTGGAGVTDGAANTAVFNCPSSVAIDADSNVVIADRNNHRIRFLDMAKKTVSDTTSFTVNCDAIVNGLCCAHLIFESKDSSPLSALFCHEQTQRVKLMELLFPHLTCESSSGS